MTSGSNINYATKLNGGFNKFTLEGDLGERMPGTNTQLVEGQAFESMLWQNQYWMHLRGRFPKPEGILQK